MKVVRTKSFEAELIRETAYSEESLGVQSSTMLLYQNESSPDEFLIEWRDSEGTLMQEMGIWTKDNKVTEYDGCFSLPIQAIDLLQEHSFDTSEVEVA